MTTNIYMSTCLRYFVNKEFTNKLLNININVISLSGQKQLKEYGFNTYIIMHDDDRCTAIIDVLL